MEGDDGEKLLNLLVDSTADGVTVEAENTVVEVPAIENVSTVRPCPAVLPVPVVETVLVRPSVG